MPDIERTASGTGMTDADFEKLASDAVENPEQVPSDAGGRLADWMARAMVAEAACAELHAEVKRLRALVAECYQCRTDNGGYIPSELGDRLGAAVRDV